MDAKKPEKIKIGKAIAAGVTVVTSLTVVVYLARHYDLSALLSEYLSRRIHPGIFIALMLVLPILGVPITFFLVLVGIKFGIVQGLLLSAAIMACQMAITYYLVHSFMRKWIATMLRSYDLAIPRFREDKNRLYAFAFMLIPGLPYSVKNYVLALADLGFAPYMTINWVAQFGLSIPFIILGGAVLEMDLKFFGAALCLLLGGYFLQQYFRKKYGKAGREG